MCYIRIDNTSKPAPRSIIISMIYSHIIPYDLREKHKAYIVKILEKLRFLKIEAEYKDKMHLKVPLRPQEYEDYLYFNDMDVPESQKRSKPILEYVDKIEHIEWALSHLKHHEYNNLYEQYKTVKDSVICYNSIIEKNKQDFKDLYKTKSLKLDFEKYEYFSSKLLGHIDGSKYLSQEELIQ